MSTITITFGDQAENHKGMEVIGELASEGFTVENLKLAKTTFEALDCKCELVRLHANIEEIEEKAYVLIVRDGINKMIGSAEDLFEEHKNLDVDTKAFMYGRVVNKKARHNLCFADYSREPNYEEGKGRIVNFQEIPLTAQIRNKLPLFFGNKAQNLVAEGNYYYDITKCGIGFHGDSERKKVIALRLGESSPLEFQWFQNSKAIGGRIRIMLNHGDLYAMSEKATGNDWKKKKMATLRHAAGCDKFLKLAGTIIN